VNHGTTIEPGGAAELVPLELPPIGGEPQPLVTKVHGLSSLPRVFLLWLAPKRTGTLLAGAGWHAAILAAAISAGLGLGLLTFELLTTVSIPYGTPGVFTFSVGMPRSELTVAEALRAPFVSLATIIHTATGSPATGGTASIILGLIPVGLLAVAVLMMPLVAAGERLGLLFGRCLRLVLWNTSTLIPLGVASFWWPSLLDRLGVAGRTEGLFAAAPPFLSDREQATIFALVLFALWWLLILWRSGLRYTGPADGPAWRPRTPRCRKCGYNIATLRVDARCPECNHPVADSVARLQRKMKPTRWRLFVASLRDALPSAKEG
jgi:hypothetical protein